MLRKYENGVLQNTSFETPYFQKVAIVKSKLHLPHSLSIYISKATVIEFYVEADKINRLLYLNDHCKEPF